MRLIVVAGLLGVGKTSVIVRLIEPLSESGRKFAIIENEFGSTGIDGDVIERGGVEVRDLRGGCVCCTLKTGLIDTLRTLQIGMGPDVAVVEPSGIADPSLIVRAVDGVTGLAIDDVTVVAIVDAERFGTMKRMFERPLRNQLSVAGHVLLNKVDAVDADGLAGIEEAIRGFGYAGPIYRARADTGEGLDALFRGLGL
ncbi:MAG: hypothetical protein GX224_06015 [Thermoplasmatales archaeon]|nr:hypothetical protein [Thermoplasmatales archaeon]